MKPDDVSTKSIRLKVQRGNAGESPVAQEYVVPGEAAPSLLDGLRWVRAHLDGSLAFRYSCINANACKECMMHLDGKTVYACLAKLTPGHSYEVAPLPNKPQIRDLVTEIGPSKERLLSGGDENDD